MVGRFRALGLVGLLLGAPVSAQAPPAPETPDASLACFFVLLEASFQYAAECGRRFSEEETRRYQRVYRRLGAYVLERGAPRGERVIQALRERLAGSAPACNSQSLQLSSRFVDEVVNDDGFPARLEETLSRDPNPLEGGCL